MPRPREGQCIVEVCPQAVAPRSMLSAVALVAPRLHGVPAQLGGGQEVFGCFAMKWSALETKPVGFELNFAEWV